MANVQIYQIPRYDILARNMFGSDTLGFLVVHQGELMDPDLSNRIKELGLIKVKDGVHPWILAVQGAYDRQARDGEYVLYARGLFNGWQSSFVSMTSSFLFIERSVVFT